MGAEPTQEERERAEALFDYIRTEVFSAAERQGALRAEPGTSKPWKGHKASIVYASLANVWENIASVPQAPPSKPSSSAGQASTPARATLS